MDNDAEVYGATRGANQEREFRKGLGSGQSELTFGFARSPRNEDCVQVCVRRERIPVVGMRLTLEWNSGRRQAARRLIRVEASLVPDVLNRTAGCDAIHICGHRQIVSLRKISGHQATSDEKKVTGVKQPC